MNRKVLYVLFQSIHDYPPCLSQVCMLRDRGVEVAVLTGACDARTRKLLEDRGVSVETFTYKEHKIRLVQKAQNLVYYTKVFSAFVKKHWTDRSVLWLGSEETAVKYWWFFGHFKPVVVNALEFYEYDWYQKGMKKIAPQADVLTACETHRAQYMVDWWNLTRMPYIMSNKPYFHPRAMGAVGSTRELRDAIAQMQGKKVLLYQGGVNADRDLVPLAKALAANGSDYWLVISGTVPPDYMVHIYQAYQKTIFLGRFPAPSHLEITSHAYAGIAYYEDNCINNRYCAPNKIYEYAGFGLPMLCNAVPGLTDTVGACGAAECVDFRDPAQIAAALQNIDEDYETYRQAALDFYNAADNSSVMDRIVADAFQRTKVEKA